MKVEVPMQVTQPEVTEGSLAPGRTFVVPTGDPEVVWFKAILNSGPVSINLATGDAFPMNTAELCVAVDYKAVPV